MKSSELFKKVVCGVNCKFGAPLGRYSNLPSEKPTDQKIFDRQVRLNCGAYDGGGAYWGFPNNLRVEYSEDLKYIRFYRTY